MILETFTSSGLKNTLNSQNSCQQLQLLVRCKWKRWKSLLNIPLICQMWLSSNKVQIIFVENNCFWFVWLPDVDQLDFSWPIGEQEEVWRWTAHRWTDEDWKRWSVLVCFESVGHTEEKWILRSFFFPAVDIYHSLTSAEGWNYMKSAGGECLILQTSVMEDQVKVLQSKFKFTKVKYSCSNKLQVPKVKETQNYLLTKKRRSLFCHQRSAETCSSERCVNECRT